MIVGLWLSSGHTPENRELKPLESFNLRRFFVLQVKVLGYTSTR